MAQPDYTNNHKRLFKQAMEIKPVWIVLVLISLLSTASIVAMMYALSTAVDAVFMQEESLSAIKPVLVLLAGAMLLRGSLFWGSEVLAQKSASTLKRLVRNRLFVHMQTLGPAWSRREQSGELAATAVEGVEKLDAFYARFLPAGIHMAIVPVVIAVFVTWIDWLSGLILIVTGPLIPIFMSLIGMKAQAQTREQWSVLTRLSSHFLDTIQGLRTLKLFNRTRSKEAEVETYSDRFRISTMGVLKIAFLSGMILELFASLATALVAVEIGIRLVEGHIGFQLGLFVLLLAPEYYLPFRAFGAQHHAGMEATEAAGRIFEILDTPANTKNTGKPGVVVPNAPYTIRFHEVSYQWPGSNTELLNRCSFTIEAGWMTALVGRSGSGKSTISRLITRQIPPVDGQITVNGLPLDLADEEEWLSRVAVVNQHTWLFDGSVLDNLKIARKNAPFEEVVSAASAAEAHEFIKQLPEGYHTNLGENASRLSGGERQRLAIARAFLKDAPFIILDEPSSALDPDSERKITRALDRLRQDRTVLVIAHRMPTVYQADRILVLEEGRITATGSHRELLEQSELYRAMAGSKCRAR